MRKLFTVALTSALLLTATHALAGDRSGHRLVKFKAGSELAKSVSRTAPGTFGPGRSPAHAPAGEVGRSCHPCPPTRAPDGPAGITINEEDKHN